MHVDLKVNCLFILHASSLFHIDINIHVSEHLREDLILHGIVNLEYINLITEIGSIQGILSHLKI